MRKLIAIASLATGMLLGAGAVQAAPMTIPALDDGIIAVAGGCGPGGYRASDGRCYPRRPPPPRYRRPCPPGMHPTPYGCRRNF